MRENDHAQNEPTNFEKNSMRNKQKTMILEGNIKAMKKGGEHTIVVTSQNCFGFDPSREGSGKPSNKLQKLYLFHMQRQLTQSSRILATPPYHIIPHFCKEQQVHPCTNEILCLNPGLKKLNRSHNVLGLHAQTCTSSMGCNKLHQGQGSMHHLKAGLLDGGTQEFLKIDYRVRFWVSRRVEEKS